MQAVVRVKHGSLGRRDLSPSQPLLPPIFPVQEIGWSRVSPRGSSCVLTLFRQRGNPSSVRRTGLREESEPSYAPYFSVLVIVARYNYTAIAT